MKFTGTRILFVLFIILGTYVYLTEFRGADQRLKQEEAKKKAFQVEDKDITEISLVYPDRTISAVKKGDKQWEMTSPAGVEADPDEWQLLASDIPRIEREDTVAQNAQDLSPYGLKDPPVKVSAKTKDGKTIEIVFGGDNPRKTFTYAKFPNSNDVFLTASNWEKTFTKSVSDLRNKKILEFEPDDIDDVKVMAGTKDLEAQKSGDTWQLKKPIDTKADGGDISTFISTVRFARAASFPEPPVDTKAAGLDQPAIKITLHDAKAKTDRALLIGKMSEKDKYYARDASRDTIFIIDKDIPEKANRPLFEWRDKTVAKIDRDKTDKIEIVQGPNTISMQKSGSDWKLADNRKLQWDKVSGMLNALDFEKAKDIIDSPKSLAMYGLDKPKLEVVLRQGSTELNRVSFGNDSKMPEGIYIKTSDGPSVKVVSKDVFDKFNVKADDLVEAPAPAEKK
ncbi:MAG TPA: DUF4340 domain-containing protein [Terriglobia bacterium]|nr:DUF4340 domain-containing protein [Terriglobia bacterium]